MLPALGAINPYGDPDPSNSDTLLRDTPANKPGPAGSIPAALSLRDTCCSLRQGVMVGAQQNGDVSRPLLDETRACGDPVTVDIEEATGAASAACAALLPAFLGLFLQELGLDLSGVCRCQLQLTARGCCDAPHSG